MTFAKFDRRAPGLFGWSRATLDIETSGAWSAVARTMAGGADRVELVVGDRLTRPGVGVRRAADWIARWAPGSHAAAAAALDDARAQGGARATLTLDGAAGEPRYWEVVLTRLAGRDAFTSVARDVTERTLEEAQLRRVAYQDGLTGLLNRAAFRERLALEIAAAGSADASVALLMLDLDNFKRINDTLGHDAGDMVLVETAARVRAVAPNAIAVGRLGGDEFAILVQASDHRSYLFALAEGLLDALRQPISFKGRILDTQASIGAAVFPAHGREPADLLKNADIALYAAKAFGRGGFTIYTASMGSALRKRAAALELVSEAIAQNRLEACYQPKVDLGANTVVGFEALLQLRRSDGSLLPAHAIRNAFDNFDIARQLGDCMFNRVAIDVRRWRDAGLDVGRIALNVSAAEFRAGDFAPRFLQRLREADLAPELFEIEVAETVLAGRGTAYVETALVDLSEAGVKVALDEFGVGASSLAQLKRLPLNSIKIDRTFVSTLENDLGDHAIVQAIIGMAQGLGLGMTAVGVESPGQVSVLRSLGCKLGQGDLLGPTMTGAEISGSTVERSRHGHPAFNG